MKNQVTMDVELHQAQLALKQVRQFLSDDQQSNKYRKNLYKEISGLFDTEIKKSFNELFDEQMAKMIECISRFDFSTRFEIIDNPALEHVAAYLNRLSEELEAIVIPANLTEAIQSTSEEAGIFITSSTGRIRRMNGKVAALLGADEDKLKNKQIDSIFKDYHIVREQLKNQSIIKNMSTHILYDDVEIPVFLSVFKSTNSIGEIEGFLYGIETELRLDNEFNYKIAAHDLLSPLSTQFTLLGILKDDCMDFHKKFGDFLELIDSLEVTNTKGIKTAKAALANTTSKKQERKPIDFEQLIDSIFHSLGMKEQNKDIETVVTVNNKVGFYTNVSIMQSIMQNLIQNAVKYRKPDQKNQIWISVSDVKNGIEIMVKDTGVGISRRRKTNLFKNVVSADSTVKESNGFGLYGVAKLVEKLKGKIKVKSTLGVGSCFMVTLPTLILNKK